MARYWDQEELQRYIDEGIEESLTLDYKAGVALLRGSNRTKEIAKDVSAMANSAGGIIIYGIAENREEDRFRPAHFSPVNRRFCSKETLEQIISSNIQPRISGIKIYPVPLQGEFPKLAGSNGHIDEYGEADNGVNQVAYVVSIPQSDTVHQVVGSKRYYKRFNFESVPMEDYEIRDVLNRASHPVVESRVGHMVSEVDEEKGAIWSIPIFAKNRSLAVAKDTAITIQFLDAKPVNEIKTDRFQIKTQPKPSLSHMYIATFPDAIHRGLNKYFGTFRVRIPAPQSLQVKIQVFASGMRAKWWLMKLNFGKDSATIQILDDDYLY